MTQPTPVATPSLLASSRSKMLADELGFWATTKVKTFPKNISIVDKRDFVNGTFKPELVYKIVKEGFEDLYVPVKFHFMNKTGGVNGKFIQFQKDMTSMEKAFEKKVAPMMVLSGEGCYPLQKVLTDNTEKCCGGIVHHGFYVDSAISEYVNNGSMEGFYRHNFLTLKLDK